MKKNIEKFKFEIAAILAVTIIVFLYFTFVKKVPIGTSLLKSLGLFAIFPVGTFGAYIRWLVSDKKLTFEDYFWESSFSTNMRIGALILSIPAMIIYIFFFY